MLREIPSLKAPPSRVIGLIEIVHRFTGDRSAMNQEFVRYLRDVSSAKESTLIRAYAVPTLNRLDLIEGQAENLHCSPDGESIVKAAQQGEAEALRRFGYILYTIDEAKGFQVLAELGLLGAETRPVSRKQLLTTLWDKHGDLLAKQGIKEKGLEDRLADWLAYLAFVCLVSIQEEGILLNPSQIQASLLENETEVPQELFTQLLLEGISDLKGRALGSTYIPIPDIRRYVMNHLLNRNLPITEIQFDEMLRKQPRTTNEYIILLSPPGRRVDGGIHIEPNYYYYISLHRMEA